jgi:hypothetical protein
LLISERYVPGSEMIRTDIVAKQVDGAMEALEAELKAKHMTASSLLSGNFKLDQVFFKEGDVQRRLHSRFSQTNQPTGRETIPVRSKI